MMVDIFKIYLRKIFYDVHKQQTNISRIHADSSNLRLLSDGFNDAMLDRFSTSV